MPRRASSSSTGWWTAAQISAARASSIAGTGEYEPIPPVFGPSVAVEDPLVVLGGGERDRALAVAQRQQRQLLALEILLDHDLLGVEAPLTSNTSSASRASASSPAMITPLPAAKPVRLDHDRISLDGPQAGLRIAEPPYKQPSARRRRAITSLQNALDPSSRAAAARRAEGADPRVGQGVDDARDERRLGSDHDEVNASAPRRGTIRSMSSTPMSRTWASPAIPALPGAHRISGGGASARARESARARARRRRRREPSANQRQMALMKSSIGIATSVSYLAVPREPSSSEIRAIVFSSGASITLMKSNWPSVAHWALTVAPELFDLPIDLFDPRGVVLDRLHPFGRKCRKHDVCRHERLVPHAAGVVTAAYAAATGSAGTKSSRSSTSAPSDASTLTVSPAVNRPSRIAIASGSTRRFWITRLRGRAP